MKNFHLPPFLCLCAIALVISTCSLEKEPEIPTGANNMMYPDALSAEVIPDTNNNFQAKAWLDKFGNLNILHHGWVWSETPKPTIEDNILDLGKLTLDSFSTVITGLELGKLFYLRPYVSTGDSTIYGTETCSFLGVDFEIATGPSILQGMQAQFTNITPGDCTYLWDFGDDSTSTEISPKHIYNKEPGTVTVTLTADI
ncbi:MAG TPA: PKD domain-containing protein, partial [Saprospiraceae bacterium]|nr:PKD domain-containing protein [Saprospiraceae bacterium]